MQHQPEKGPDTAEECHRLEKERKTGPFSQHSGFLQLLYKPNNAIVLESFSFPFIFQAYRCSVTVSMPYSC